MPSSQYDTELSIASHYVVASHDAKIDLSSIPVSLELCRTNRNAHDCHIYFNRKKLTFWPLYCSLHQSIHKNLFLEYNILMTIGLKSINESSEFRWRGGVGGGVTFNLTCRTPQQQQSEMAVSWSLFSLEACIVLPRCAMFIILLTSKGVSFLAWSKMDILSHIQGDVALSKYVLLWQTSLLSPTCMLLGVLSGMFPGSSWPLLCAPVHNWKVFYIPLLTYWGVDLFHQSISMVVNTV